MNPKNSRKCLTKLREVGRVNQMYRGQPAGEATEVQNNQTEVQKRRNEFTTNCKLTINESINL